MIHKTFFTALGLVAAFALASTSAQADLKVDFGGAGGPASGWDIITTDTATTLTDGTTLTFLTTADWVTSSNNQGPGGFTGDLGLVASDYFYLANPGSASVAYIELGELDILKEYRLTIIAVRDAGQTASISIDGSFGDSTPNGDTYNQRSQWEAGNVLVWNSLTPDNSGVITITATRVGAQFTFVNGFILEEVIPEPASMALMGLGSMLLFGRTRRA